MDVYRHYAGIILPIIEMLVLYGATVRLGWDFFSIRRTPPPADAFFITLLMCFLLVDSHHDEWLDVVMLGGLATGVLGQTIMLAIWERMERRRNSKWPR